MNLFGKKSSTKNNDFENIKKELAKSVKIALGYRSINQFASMMKMVNSRPLVDLYNEEINALPDRKLLRKIALHSEGRITHLFLYDIVGYSENDPEEDRTWRTWIPKRGSIYFADLGFGEDSIQGGQRPVLIVGNDLGLKHSDILFGIPISTKRKGNDRMHVHLGKEFGLEKDSYALCEQTRVMSKRRFFYNDIPWEICNLDEQKMREVNNILEFQLGIKELYFNEEKAFIMVERVKTLQKNLKEKSNDFISLYNEKFQELIDYCSKYRKDYRFVIKEYERINNFAY